MKRYKPRTPIEISKIAGSNGFRLGKCAYAIYARVRISARKDDFLRVKAISRLANMTLSRAYRLLVRLGVAAAEADHRRVSQLQRLFISPKPRANREPTAFDKWAGQAGGWLRHRSLNINLTAREIAEIEAEKEERGGSFSKALHALIFLASLAIERLLSSFQRETFQENAHNAQGCNGLCKRHKHIAPLRITPIPIDT